MTTRDIKIKVTGVQSVAGADDEPEVLRSIQRTLDWEKYGFSVVGAFLNGLDVLEFLEITM